MDTSGPATHTRVQDFSRLFILLDLAYAKAVGRDKVIAGTDCGLGGRVHSQIAWAKNRVLVEGARLASSELWGN